MTAEERDEETQGKMEGYIENDRILPPFRVMLPCLNISTMTELKNKIFAWSGGGSLIDFCRDT